LNGLSRLPDVKHLHQAMAETNVQTSGAFWSEAGTGSREENASKQVI
jgi:hypothetical protein